MKQLRKKKNSIHFACFVLALAVLAVFPSEAAKKQKKVPAFPKTWNLYLTGNPDQDTSLLVFDYLPKKAKIVKVTADSKSEADVSVYEWNSGERDIQIIIRKTGTFHLKIRVKMGKKTYNLKSKITVRRHRNILSSVKLGKKEFKNSFENAEYITLPREKGKKRFRVKPAAGWELKDLTYYYENKTRKLKNGGILNFNKVSGQILVEIKLSKVGTKEERLFKIYFE